MAEVVFKNIVKRYGPVEVVKSLSLEIHDGEFLVLVGASGCGKSTTLRLLAGLEETDSGEIYIGDRQVNQLPPKDRDIAMVFQNYALYPHMTVYDNVAFGLKMRKVPKSEIDPKVQEAARMLGIENLLDRRPKQLSGGQRQRVALARALVRRPQAFLMDEPLSNLDAKLRAQTRTEIKKLHQRLGTTTIYVTHDQVEAMTMGDRIAVMKDGVIQQLAAPLETYDYPTNMFVAGFIGSPAMNVVPVQVTGVGDGMAAVEGTGFNLKLPCPDDQSLKPYLNRRMMLGVRPEHVSLTAADETADAVAQIEVVEPSGPRTLLHLKLGEQPFVAEVDTAQLGRLGQEQARLRFEIGKLHLFDPDTQQTIVSTQRAVAKA